MAVEVGAGPVVAHRGARIRVAGSDLDVLQVHARIQHGRNERVAQHVRVRLAQLDTGRVCQAPQAATAQPIEPCLGDRPRVLCCGPEDPGRAGSGGPGSEPGHKVSKRGHTRPGELAGLSPGQTC
jgi:hypothetical protein